MDGLLRNMTGTYITNEGSMLMLYRIGSRVVSPSWCGIGGHFEENELNDPKACALRELYEEAGIKEEDLTDLKLRYITLRNKNNEVRQNYYFFTELKNKELELPNCNEGKLAWIDLDQVMEKEMPFTAKKVLEHYFSTGRYNDKLYAGATTENGVVFTELKEF